MALIVNTAIPQRPLNVGDRFNPRYGEDNLPLAFKPDLGEQAILPKEPTTIFEDSDFQNLNMKDKFRVFGEVEPEFKNLSRAGKAEVMAKLLYPEPKEPSYPQVIGKSIQQGVASKLQNIADSDRRLMGEPQPQEMKAGTVGERLSKLGHPAEELANIIKPEVPLNFNDLSFWKKAVSGATQMAVSLPEYLIAGGISKQAVEQSLPIITSIGERVAKIVGVKGVDFIRKAAENIGTFGLGEKFSGGEGTHGAAMGIPFTVATLPASRLMRILLTGAIGYEGTAISKGTQEDQLINGMLMSAFGAMSDPIKKTLLTEIKANPQATIGELPSIKAYLQLEHKTGADFGIKETVTPPTDISPQPAYRRAGVVPEKIAMEEYVSPEIKQIPPDLPPDFSRLLKEDIRRSEVKGGDAEYVTPDIQSIKMKPFEEPKGIEGQPVETELTPIEKAGQHGEVIGIDAKTKLPIIDTSIASKPKSPIDKSVIGRNDLINDITLGDALQRAEDGENVSKHLKEGVDKFGADAMQHAFRNGLQSDMGQMSKGLRKVTEKNIQPIQKSIDKALEGKKLPSETEALKTSLTDYIKRDYPDVTKDEIDIAAHRVADIFGGVGEGVGGKVAGAGNSTSEAWRRFANTRQEVGARGGRASLDYGIPEFERRLRDVVNERQSKPQEVWKLSLDELIKQNRREGLPTDIEMVKPYHKLQVTKAHFKGEAVPESNLIEYGIKEMPEVPKPTTVNEQINKLIALGEVDIAKTPEGKFRLDVKNMGNEKYQSVGEFNTIDEARQNVITAHKKVLEDFRANKRNKPKVAEEAPLGAKYGDLPLEDRAGLLERQGRPDLADKLRQEEMFKVERNFPQGKLQGKGKQKEGFEMTEEIKARENEEMQGKIDLTKTIVEEHPYLQGLKKRANEIGAESFSDIKQIIYETLSSPQNARARQSIIKQLGNEDIPIAKAGINRVLPYIERWFNENLKADNPLKSEKGGASGETTEMYAGLPISKELIEKLKNPAEWFKGLKDYRAFVKDKDFAEHISKDFRSKFNQEFIFPRTLVGEFPDTFKPIYEKINNYLRQVDLNISKYVEIIKPYYDLNDKSLVDQLLVKSRMDDKIYTDIEASKMGLKEKEITAYKSVLDTTKQALNNLESELIKAGNDPKEVKQYISQLPKAYVPLSRFGDYFVSIKDAQGKPVKVTFHDSKREMAAEVMKARKTPNVTVDYGEVGKLAESAYHGMPLSVLSILKQFDNELGTKLSAEYSKIIGKGFPQHLIHAEKVKGFETDLSKPIADYILSISRYTAGKGARQDLADLLTKIDPKKQHGLYDYSTRYIDDVMNGKSSFNKMRKFLFHYYLGGNIKSALLNLTQPITVTYPVLSKYTKKSLYELTKGFSQANKYLFKGKIDPELEQAIKIMIEDGSISEQMVNFIKGERHGKGLTGGMISKILSAFFGNAEKYNRLVTGITGFNIAKGKGMNFNDAVKFAENLNEETQFNYSMGNRPQIARGKLAPLFIFRQFTGNYLSLMKNSLKEGEYETVAKMLGVMVAMGGTMAIPGIKELEKTLEMAGYDPKKIVKDTMGKYGDLALHGGLFPLGVDISGSLGTMEFLPEDIKNLSEMKGDLKKVVGAVGITLAGVPADLPSRVFRAYNILKTQRDPYRAVETLMPEMIRNPMVAYRWATDAEGMARTPQGKPIYKPSTKDIALKTMAIQPSKLSKTYEREHSEKLLKGKVTETKDMTENYHNLMAKAVIKGDAKGYQKLLQEVLTYNTENPKEPITLSSEGFRNQFIKLKYPEMGELKSLPKWARPEYMDIQRSYNNTEGE